MEQPKIFVSHSHDDAAFADPLVALPNAEIATTSSTIHLSLTVSGAEPVVDL